MERFSSRRIVGFLVLAFGSALLVSCGGGDSSESTSTTVSEATSVPPVDPAETTAAPHAGGQAGLFDFNQDGMKETTCGTADFKAGLVVRTYCDDLSGYASEPAEGATPIPGALRTLPSPSDDPRDKQITEGASVNVQHLQSADGKEVVVLTLSSDTVFAVGSDKLQDPALESLTNIANGIRTSYPGAAVQVRGHTDSTGSAAANQSLSERRAASVAAYFGTKGIDKAKLTSAGLGQTVPNYQEKNPDGSESSAGRDQNRRIEVVIRPG